MRLVKRLVVATAIAAAVLAPALPAAAGQTPAPSVAVPASWHNSDPFYSWATCDLNRRSAASEGYPTQPCEQHPVSLRWYFLIWW